MTISRIGVVGAGMMGSEIALVFAMAGKDVLLTDKDEARLAGIREQLTRTLDKGVERGFWSDEDRRRVLGSLRVTPDLDDYGDRQMVIEAVFEDEQVKEEIFVRLDEVCAKDCILASNTSSISISVLASHVSPERRPHFAGTHFFSPVSRMKLVEVMPTFDTDEATIEAVMAVCREAGKEPIRVKDVVGFAVNRVLHALLIEAARLVEEGVATPADIDKACKLGLGHPVGPFELMDLVSNKLSLQVQDILHDAYGERFRPRPLYRQMVRAGLDGRRAGRGWHEYPAKPKG